MIATPSTPTAAYIHVPFCAHRCGYCDFTLVAGKDHLIAEYLKALELQLQELGSPRQVETLFLGGGTPSHLSIEQLTQLFELLTKWFHLSDDYEFSIEVNPIDITAEKAQLFGAAGINRVSLGVQSFDKEVLKLLERDHSPHDVEIAFERLQPVIGNLAFDLIFGVPGQSKKIWEESLVRATELGPQHISTYGLTYEKGTSFWTRREKRELLPVSEDVDYSMYQFTLEFLQTAGFAQYEISNFAQSGFECRHNNVYWAGKEFYAFGPGAARYLDGRRETNHRSVTTWIKRMTSGQTPIAEAETLSPEDRARELIVLGLRRTAGILRDEFQKQSGFDLDELAGEIIKKQIDAGLIEDFSTGIRLTRSGLFLADTVVVDFL